MTRRSFLELLGTAVLVPLIGCAGPRFTYRYRMTVEVDTPAGLRTGSSVIEVTTRWDNAPPHASGVHSRVRGQAVAVDMPGGDTLFALLRNDKSGIDAAQYYAREALGFTGGQSMPTPIAPRCAKCARQRAYIACRGQLIHCSCAFSTRTIRPVSSASIPTISPQVLARTSRLTRSPSSSPMMQ